MRTASVRRTVAAALIAGAFGIAAGSAQAASFADDFTGDHTGTTGVSGSVELASYGDAFDTMAWTAFPHEASGTATTSDGLMKVDGARANSGKPATSGSSLRFRANFREAFQHVGYATTFGTSTPWAIVSSGDGTAGVVARVVDGGAEFVHALDVPLNTAQDYRIDRTASGFSFYVGDDSTPKFSQDISLAGEMTAQASDAIANSTLLTLDWMSQRTTSDSGTYTSKVFDAGDSRVTGIAFSPADTRPSGTTLSYRTRSGNTATPDASWTAWGAPGATRAGRYFQYDAQMTTDDALVSPRITNATVNFAVDATGPAVAIGAIGVSGSSATVPFSSDDGSASYECSMDSGAYSPCSSGVQFGGLGAGTHTVTVRGKDGYGNVGTASKQFAIAAPQASGGDTKKPKLGMPRDADVNKRGKVRILLTCPADELFCRAALVFKSGGKTIASKSGKIAGGDSRYITLKLSTAAKKQLAKARKLKVAATLTVSDAAGNKRTSSKKIWLYPM